MAALSYTLTIYPAFRRKSGRQSVNTLDAVFAGSSCLGLLDVLATVIPRQANIDADPLAAIFPV